VGCSSSFAFPQSVPEAARSRTGKTRSAHRCNNGITAIVSINMLVSYFPNSLLRTGAVFGPRSFFFNDSWLRVFHQFHRFHRFHQLHRQTFLSYHHHQSSIISTFGPSPQCRKDISSILDRHGMLFRCTPRQCHGHATMLEMWPETLSGFQRGNLDFGSSVPARQLWRCPSAV
jgi:hypothetical protein